MFNWALAVRYMLLWFIVLWGLLMGLAWLFPALKPWIFDKPYPF